MLAVIMDGVLPFLQIVEPGVVADLCIYSLRAVMAGAKSSGYPSLVGLS